MKLNCITARRLFVCSVTLIVSLFTLNTASACINSVCSQSPNGVTICTNSISTTCAPIPKEKTLNYSSLTKDMNYVSIIDRNLKFENMMQREQTDYLKPNSLNKFENKYSMIKYNKNNPNVHPRDSFVRADRITVNNDDDIIISGS